MKIDNRPDPKPRKHPRLWQTYLLWNEMVETRKRHTLRVSSIEAGKSNLDAQLEKDIMSDLLQVDSLVTASKKLMVQAGEELGPVWKWITSIKGMGEGGLAAQLIAQIDDISSFTTISKLWRFSGLAVVDGQAEHNKTGEKSHFNRRLKSVCWLISDQFIRQQTPGYVDIYYAEKERLRRLYPEKVENTGPSKKVFPYLYTDAHIHNMAKRKMVKIFLQHLWVTWRESEGLPISDPYVQAILSHTNILTPAMMEI